MAMTLLRRLEAHLDSALPEVDTLAPRLTVHEIPARAAAFQQGVVCPYVYVVRSGLLKQLYTEPDGSEWIKSFAGPGDLFACLKAISGQAPTTFSSVAIEHSVVERIDFRCIEAMAEKHLAWQRALRVVFQKLAEIKVQRERDLLTMTARELYQSLAAAAPLWIGKVPQKDLAGFLGVTPVGLNRIIRGAPGTRGRAARRPGALPGKPAGRADVLHGGGT